MSNPMWEPNEIRLMRWFMRFAGVGLVIPGVLYLTSWPDTVKAFASAFTTALSPALAGFTGAGLILAGATFLAARYARAGAVVGFVALLLGAVVHYQWSAMMQSRLPILAEHIDPEQRAMLKDTVLFAANAQIPHILKNAVLMGLCAMLFCLAPRICGNRVERPNPINDHSTDESPCL